MTTDDVNKQQLAGILKDTFSQNDNEGDIDYMPPILAAHERRPHRFAPILLVSVVSFFIVALIWAYFAELEEVTRGVGRVIPSGQIKTIDHLEGGIVKAILVSDGENVEEGQLLLRIDNIIAQARLREGEEHYYRSLTAADRLKAQIAGKEFVVPKIVQEKAPEAAEKEMERFHAAKERLLSETQIAKHDVQQRQQELLELEGRVKQLTIRHELALEELMMTAPLVKKGVAAKIELIRIKRDVNDIEGELNSTKVNIPRAQAALDQAAQRYKQVALTMRGEDFRELRETERRLSEARDAITTERDRLSRTDVRSPVRGTIKELLVHTIGGVVQPGQDLIVIVPLGDTLLIEAQVRPADVAFLRPGLPAIVKISAYDFAIYGGLDAKLIDISADAIKDEKDNEFFRIRLQTDKNHLVGKHGGELPISVGMTASVDVLTGKKTVLQYIMKPIMRAKHVAMRER